MDNVSKNLMISHSPQVIGQLLDAAAADFLQALENFEPAEINIIPYESSWTAGQVVEHIFISMKAIGKVLNGATKENDRNPIEKVKPTADMFLNFTTKFKSSQSLEPSDDKQVKGVLVENLKVLFGNLTTIAFHHDLTQICTSFKLPVLGEFTKVEWLYFCVFHSTRHAQQLKNIREHLNQL